MVELKVFWSPVNDKTQGDNPQDIEQMDSGKAKGNEPQLRPQWPWKPKDEDEEEGEEDKTIAFIADPDTARTFDADYSPLAICRVRFS